MYHHLGMEKGTGVGEAREQEGERGGGVMGMGRLRWLWRKRWGRELL